MKIVVKGPIPRDSHLRSIAKALSYRLSGTAVTISVAWAVTGEGQFAATIGVVDTLVKIAIYYIHERAWNRIRSKSPDCEV